MSASSAATMDDTSRHVDPVTRQAQVAALTGLRGFAALMVVLVHVSVRTDYLWLGINSYGPISLFVLSGYLLYRPWAKWGMQVADSPSIPKFTRRRLARIFPAYLVVFLVVVVVDPASRPEGAGGWFYATTLTWIYAPGQFPIALAQTWSLATELSWYVALPVMGGITALIARRLTPHRGFWLTVAMILTSIPITAAWRWWVADSDLDIHFTYTFWLPGYLVCFAGGALVALFVEGDRAGLVSLRRARALAADPWALLVFALAMALLGTSSVAGPDGYVPRSFAEEEVRFTTVTLLALTLLVVVVLGRLDSPFNRLLSTRWFVATGRWSYGIYLWHLPLIVITEKRFGFPDGVGGLVLQLGWVLALSISLAAATYAWVERPAIAWSHGSRTRLAPAAASSTTSSQPTAAPATTAPRLPPGE